jgi:LPS export ABC transporter protein LptC/lipopolysaccharide transport protein LptA
MKWQRIARLVIAVAAVAFAIGVAVNMRHRAPQKVEAPLPNTDLKAVVESGDGQSVRVNREKEQVRLQYEKLLTYSDGSSKLLGVTVTTDRSGRSFTMKGKEGKIGHDESTVELDGDVHVVANDGLTLTTEHATYTEADGVVRAPGPVSFAKGRMHGSGVGFDYNKNSDTLLIFDQAQVHVAAGKDGLGVMDVASGALEFKRRERTLRFDRGMKATRAHEVLEADAAVAHLSDDEQRLEAVELREHSRITATAPAPGALQSLSGRNIDLKYGADGQSLEHAGIDEDAVLQLAGDGHQPGRQISARVIDLSLAADGATVIALNAHENVKLNLPAEQDGVSRTIASQTLESGGDGHRGLTNAHFTGSVQFGERGPGVSRAARSAVLDVAMAPGFSSIDDAKFSRGVRFADGPLFATSAAARYLLGKGVLELSGSEPGSLVPHIVNEQIAIDAEHVEVTLDGPIVEAEGDVKSVLQPKKEGSGSAAMKMPSMLKQDQPVNVTAEQLDYQGKISRATYTGKALLWQAETQIKAPSIVIDSESGNLNATGTVATVAMLLQEKDNGEKERVRSNGAGKTFDYDDATRRATYTDDAHVRGPQGDLTATKIELYLKPSGDELDRVEGYDTVVLRSDGRKTTGDRLTYFGDEGRYVVTGAPVTILDNCGRETTGHTLTFFRSTDRIIVDGNDQTRTQSKGKSNCPGS